MLGTILSLIVAGVQTWNNERKIYYVSKVRILQKKIQDVEDSDFYNKDMEAKGKAERELDSDGMALAQEYLKESKK